MLLQYSLASAALRSHARWPTHVSWTQRASLFHRYLNTDDTNCKASTDTGEEKSGLQGPLKGIKVRFGGIGGHVLLMGLPHGRPSFP